MQDTVQKANYAVKMYGKLGFEVCGESKEEFLMMIQGALRVVWYCATKAIQGADSYSDIRDFIQRGSDKRLNNPMVTPSARKKWDEKMQIRRRA